MGNHPTLPTSKGWGISITLDKEVKIVNNVDIGASPKKELFP